MSEMSTAELRKIAIQACKLKNEQEVERVCQLIKVRVPMKASAGNFSHIHNDSSMDGVLGDRVVQRLKEELGWNVYRTGISIVVEWYEPRSLPPQEPTKTWKDKVWAWLKN